MRILHVVSSLDPAQGGLSAVALRLATAQTLLGHQAALLTQDSADESRAFHAAHGVEHSDRVARLVASAPSLGEILSGRDSTGAISRALRETDVVHLHGLWDPLLFYVARVARRVGTPYVVAPHGMVDPWSLAQKSWKKRVALFLGYRTLLRRAMFVHALNDAEARFVRDLRIHGPVEILPNGVFLDEVDAGRDSPGDYFQERFGWPGRNTLLFLGRLHWKKGLDILAEAFAEFAGQNADARLVIAGPDGGQRTAFENQVARFGLADRVAIPGPIYGAEKYRALRGAAAFVLPSRQEGFSIAILEALACGTPVVISEACHFPEVVEHRAGMAVDLSPSAHAGAYRRIFADPDEAKRMGTAGRELVAARYTWNAVARRSIDLYGKYGCCVDG